MAYRACMQFYWDVRKYGFRWQLIVGVGKQTFFNNTFCYKCILLYFNVWRKSIDIAFCTYKKNFALYMNQIFSLILFCEMSIIACWWHYIVSKYDCWCSWTIDLWWTKYKYNIYFKFLKKLRKSVRRWKGDILCDLHVHTRISWSKINGRLCVFFHLLMVGEWSGEKTEIQIADVTLGFISCMWTFLSSVLKYSFWTKNK